MPATYENIATTTITAATAASVNFSSIASTFTDLILVIQADENVASAHSVYLRFNGDSGNNYSRTLVFGDGSSAGSARSSNASGIAVNIGSEIDNNINIHHIMNYSNATTNKTVLSRTNNNNGTVGVVGLWRNTAAINQITIVPITGSLVQNSTFTLYGIKAA